MTNEPTVLSLSRSDRLVVWIGLPALGLLAAAGLPVLARWALDLGIGLPFGVVFRIVGAIDTPWEIGLHALLWGGLGLLAASELVRRAPSATVGMGEVALESDGRRRTLGRGEIEAVFLDGDALVLLDRESREAFRCEKPARAATTRQVFQQYGYPWRDTDPFAELYHRWVPDTGLLPVPVDAVLSARAVALRKKAGKEAVELREAVEKLGYTVRDEGDKQFWRPLVSS